jgi:hypothetical protein
MKTKLWINLWITWGLIALTVWTLLPLSLSSQALYSNYVVRAENLASCSLSSPDIILVKEAKQVEKNMLKLERLTLAMAEYEGWLHPLADPKGIGSRSFRNNNPGNLRVSPFSVGVRDGFAVFNSEADGFAAFRWDIMQKAKGNTSTGLNGDSTLKQLIYVWAPPADNNHTENYLAAVLKMTGFTAETRLTELVK